MKRGKAFLDMRPQAAQRLGVLFGIEKARNGLEADRLAQTRCRALLVDRRARYRSDLYLPRTVGDDVEQQHAGENDGSRDHEQQDVADYFDQPAHGVSGSSWFETPASAGSSG
jgi:hypothetical protein